MRHQVAVTDILDYNAVGVLGILYYFQIIILSFI